jgi:TPR repeat protein
MLKKSWFGRLLSPPVILSAQELQARADESGSEAQNNLGAFLANTDLTVAAAVSYRKAAESGNPMAQHNLAMMYATGEGVTRDHDLAMKWFSRAAAQGDPAAQFQLGDHCFRASLTLGEKEAAERLIQALMWLQLAHDQGYPNAETCSERVNLRMSGEAIAESRRRVGVFVALAEKASD